MLDRRDPRARVFSVDAWFAIAFSEINGQPRSEFPRSLYPLSRFLRTNAHDSLKNLSRPTGVSPVCAKPFPVNRPSFQTDLYKSCLSPPKLCPSPPTYHRLEPLSAPLPFMNLWEFIAEPGNQLCLLLFRRFWRSVSWEQRQKDGRAINEIFCTFTGLVD